LAGYDLRYDELTTAPLWSRAQSIQNADWIYRRLVDNATVDELGESGRFMPNELVLLTDLVGSSLETCDSDESMQRWLFAVHEVMVIAIPNIDGPRGTSLVDTVANAECATQREPIVISWMQLYGAVARRDAGMLLESATRLLADDSVTEPFLLDYLVGGALLGEIAQDRPGGAKSIWELWGQQRPADLKMPAYLTLLSSIAEAADSDLSVPVAAGE